jgi:putative ABC transport system substrate-binding protein
LSPDVIVASTGTAVVALRDQTPTIPIVGVLLPDPVANDVVQSLARPGGNITGFTSFDAPIIGKWLQLLKDAVPGITRVAVLFDPSDSYPYPSLKGEIEAAARAVGITVMPAPVHDDATVEEAVTATAHDPGGALVCLPSSFNTTHRDLIIAAANRLHLPVMGTWQFPRSGGLMSYQWDTVDLHARAASYVDRILRGAKPVDLPVQQPTKFSLVINLKAAKKLGLTIPPAVLDMADEVIE